MAKAAQTNPSANIDIQVERWLIGRLIPRGNNPRTHSNAQITQIAASIRESGWINPVLVGGNGIDTLLPAQRTVAQEQYWRGETFRLNNYLD